MHTVFRMAAVLFHGDEKRFFPSPFHSGIDHPHEALLVGRELHVVDRLKDLDRAAVRISG